MNLPEIRRLFQEVERSVERAGNALDSLGKDGGPDWEDPFYTDARAALREATHDTQHALAMFAVTVDHGTLAESNARRIANLRR